MLEVILLLVFCVDIIVSFFVGYYDKSGILRMSNADAARHYMRYGCINSVFVKGGGW